MRITRKSGLIFTTGTTVVLTLGSYLIRDYPEARLHVPSIMNFLDLAQLPGAFVGIAISGNVHQPNVVVTYLVLFVLYWLVIGIATWLFSFAIGRRA